ncbi:MAG: hypothetical protein P9M03_09625 [Candidatus Theseobacter exili]|nr:hypothetical protein [Candidatus Theseobacter exili]
MEKTTEKGMEKIVISKDAKALLPVIDMKDLRPHFRGFLIKGGNILATDSKILARMPLNAELPKQDVPTNVQTGADTERVWISFETMKKALSNIPKKTSLPAIQNNIFVNKTNGSMTLQVLDEGLNAVSFEERGNNESLATDFPETDKILNPEEKDVERKSIKISAETLIKLSDMVKSLGKDTRITLEIADYKHPVFFKVEDRNTTKIDGAFMLLKTEETK